MIVTAVARVRNEEDIVEAFVRHHAAMVDRLILLDNDSNDRTRAILHALRDEGLPLTLFAAASCTFMEAAHNTFLARQAAALGADWVLCLDGDEFVDQRRIPGGLRNYLAALPPHVVYLHAGLMNYCGTDADDQEQPIVPVRFRYRDHTACALKVLVRLPLILAGATLENGNHEVIVQGERLAHLHDDNLVLAHYPVRSGWQQLAKAVTGRLKVLAAGEPERDAAIHYTGLLANLETDPEQFIRRDFVEARRWIDGRIVDDPIDYLGGPLRHTLPTDAWVHAARSLLAAAEALARRHGGLLDAVAGARERMYALDNEISRVF